MAEFWISFSAFLVSGYDGSQRGFQGRFLTVEPSSRFSGHPAGGWSVLITSYQMLPLEASFGPTFDLRTGSRVSGRFLFVDSKSSITGPPRTFPIDIGGLFLERMTMPISWGSLASFPLSCGYKVDRGLLEALASFWDPTHCCFSIGEVDLIPTMEEYAELLPARQPLQRDPANISLDLLTKYFSRSAFPARLARDFIAGKKEWKKFRINAFKIAFAGDRERGSRCSAHSSFSSGSAVTCSISIRLQTPYHFERHTVSQTVQIALPFTGDSRAWALYLLDLPLSHYPSLALRQFSGVQYPPRLGDLDAVTFDYIPQVRICGGSSSGLRTSGEVVFQRWSSSRRVRPEIALLPRTLSSGERGGLPFFTLRPTVRPGAPYSLISRSLRVSASTGRLREEASAARVESLRSTLHHNSVAVANLRRDLVAQRGNVSTLRTMNEFIREQLEISEDAKEQLEENLAEAREQLETEQAERTRVQDELDSLRSYTQALVDPATGRPQDIVALRRALDASEEALTSARTSMGVMRVQISVLQGDNGVLQSELDLVHDALESNASWLNQEGFPVVTSLHQINQVMDSLGARARAVWEEHDEGDPALSTALGRFCRETCIRLGH
uniref:DUF7745 domain-containing protein n=1 Tax=Fagus sylvatica TaxID=28930 RepID=A0A2N9IKL1_FAGSY